MKMRALQRLCHAPVADEALLEWVKDAMDLKAALDEHAIVAITDSLGRITSVNDKFCAVSGYTREEVLGQDYRLVNSGYHSAKFFRALWRTINSGLVWHGEMRNRAKDGSHFWVATTIVPCLGPNEQPRQFVSISSDITEQKRLSERLEGKLRLQSLLADLSARFVGLCDSKVDEALHAAQQQIVETFGLDRTSLWQYDDSCTSMVLTHCWQPPGWPALPGHFPMDGHLPWTQARIESGEGIQFSSIADLPLEAAQDAEALRRFGAKSNLTIPLLANGEVFGAISFSTLRRERKWTPDDVAELRLVAQIIGNVVGRQRAEEKADQLRRELAHTMRVAALGGLAEGLAHELNQPLAAILSNAQAARRFMAGGGIDPEELQNILDDIVRADKRAGSVIHNLRAMVSNRPVDREPCCVNEIVAEVQALLHAELLGERIEVRSTLALDLPLVQAARVELQQVLMNLFVNALHAMKDTPAAERIICVETRADAGSVVMCIRDHGHGIAPERVASVFEPFFSTKADGLGMGLSICRKIIESHQGRIKARNRAGGGAEFCITIPAMMTPGMETKPSPARREVSERCEATAV